MSGNALRIIDEGTGEEYTFSLKNGKLSLIPLGSHDPSEDDAILVSMNWPAVNGVNDGDPMIAETFNRPIKELAERTSYLYEKLRVFNRNEPLGSVMITEATLASENTPATGDVVYLDPDNRVYRKALSTTSLFDDFSAADSSYAAGIVVARKGTTANILLFGRLDMTLTGINIDNMLEQGEKFRPGVYYLSSDEPGKLTANPRGPRVVIGKFTGGEYSLVNIHVRDFGEAHVHRSYGIKGLPAGDQMLTADDPTGIHIYLGYSPDRYAEAGNPDEDIYPGIMFSGEWLASEDVTYKFTLEGYMGGLPAEKFGASPGVFLHWETGSGDKYDDGYLEFTDFDTPVEFKDGVYVSLTCGDPAAYEEGGTTDDKYVYKVTTDEQDKREWTEFTFPDVGLGWRKLTKAEEAAYSSKYARSNKKPVFVYNIGFDKNLQTFFPPIPLKSAALVMNGVELGSNKFGDKTFTYSIEQDSIYWFDNTWDHAPWPTGYFNRYSAPEEWEERKTVLHFIRTTTSETGPVMSISGAPGSGIRVVSCASGSPASVGDLMIDFDPLGDVVEDDLSGYKVVKAGGNGVFKTGPVVEKIVPGTGISITRLGGAPVGQGTVVINAVNSGISGDFEEVALQNAKQDMVGLFPYIRLLGWDADSQTNVQSAFIMKFHVPYDNKDAMYKVHMYASVFGTQSYMGSAAQYAGLKIDYSILPDLNAVSDSAETGASANVKDDLIEPDNSRVVEIPMLSEIQSGVTVYTAFDPVLVTTEDDNQEVQGKRYHALGMPIPAESECTRYMQQHLVTAVGVRPGYTVAVRFSRGPAVSGVQQYVNPIGFMNMRWSLERVVDA